MRRTDVPLFVSRRMLSVYKTPPRARGMWALDSGGFSELSLFGEWSVSREQYVREVRFWRRECGNLAWAAPMDYMCEPSMLAKTGLTVAEHQRRTVDNFLRLQEQLPNVVIPVLQGWEFDDYHRCIERYDRAGVDLRDYPTVGIGSVCRRNQNSQIVAIMRSLHNAGLRCHAFGVKGAALKVVQHEIVSADSLAWSYRARFDEPMPGHTHQNCANCLPYALRWRDRLLAKLEETA